MDKKMDEIELIKILLTDDYSSLPNNCTGMATF